MRVVDKPEFAITTSWCQNDLLIVIPVEMDALWRLSTQDCGPSRPRIRNN